jgi:hypothetical protein
LRRPWKEQVGGHALFKALRAFVAESLLDRVSFQDRSNGIFIAAESL